MRILHTGDWHIGSMKGPERDGMNLRLEDTIRCLEEMVSVAEKEKPELVLAAGDIFHQAEIWQGRSHRELHIARSIIKKLSEVSGEVIVMRGTPNHDAAEIFMSLTETFERFPNVKVVTQPQVVQTEYADIVVIPGFDKGQFRAKFPGRSKEEENDVFSKELGNMVVGMKAMCREGKMAILMSHYTVPGCNTESGQIQMFTKAEPVITQDMLRIAGYELAALGHIHRPQFIPGFDTVCYSGAINAFNFNDEGQERGFWIHNVQDGVFIDSVFHKTPYREFLTIRWDKEDVGQAVLNPDALPMVFSQAGVADKIVRIIYSCTEEQKKAINTAQIERALYDAGAFYKADIIFDVVEDINKTELSKFDDPEANLIKYLEEKQIPPDKIPEMVMKARPIMAEAKANMPTAVNHGTFEPVEIAVKNYRNYEDETFNFQDITFCTINGQNGAGKSSLFMDAIIDCLYEEPREKELTGWVRNDDNGCKGAIMFTFRIGEKTYRIARTRNRPKKDAKEKTGKATLNISELVNGEWEDRSKERYDDTQKEILNIIGMDSFAFKSCALIMQDQYGLFLQAKPVERVEVLGTLLGLGVYQIMENIAHDKMKAYRTLNSELKQKIEIHSNTISGFGDPDQGLAVCRTDLAEYESSLQVKTAERDKYKLLLANRQEAAERHRKLLTAIAMLEVKRDDLCQNRTTQQATIESCSVILNERLEIEAKVAEHKALMERKLQLAGESALYSAKKIEAENLVVQAVSEQRNIANLKARIEQKEEELSLAQPTDQDAVVKENAAEYERQKRILEEAYEQERAYREVDQKLTQAKYSLKQITSQHESDIKRLQLSEDALKKKAELLSNVECVDISRAKCGFLVDAVSAKQALKDYPGRYAELEKIYEDQAVPLKQQIAELEKELSGMAFDAGKIAAVSSRIAVLKPYVVQLEAINQRESRIALIEADLKHLQSNVAEAEERLTMVKLKSTEAGQERDRYAKAFEEHASILRSITLLEPWLEKEKQLPVAEERKATAMRRVLELDGELAAIIAEIGEKQAEADKEALGMNGTEEFAGIVARMNAEVDAVNALVKGKQMQIGALQQKSEQISKLKKEIAELREKQAEYAKEEADYEALKTAFSQSGVPHQIIRSIIPKLTATSNTILGQMTGGKMGVEFRLERLQKNKEKASLDIYIEEYGKSTLPYLSKSGGEKVKSSLSVILALAEIKSCSAGIQLGMLFIDEPPFLDGDGIQAYCDALETIQSRYPNIKIMAITHDPTMKARFPQNLDVVKTEHGSKVIY